MDKSTALPVEEQQASRTVARIVQFIFHLLFTATLIIILALKYVEFGFEACTMFYTNWSGGFLTLFFIVTVFGYVNTGPLNHTFGGTALWVAWTFFALNGTVFSVYTGVLVLYFVDAEFLSDLFEEHGVGMVLFANAYFHVFPVISDVLYAFFQNRMLIYGLQRTYQWSRGWSLNGRSADRHPTFLSVLWVIYQVWLGTLLVLSAYVLVLWVWHKETIGDVYMSTLDPDTFPRRYATLLTYAGVIIVTTLVNGIPLLLLFSTHVLSRQRDLAYLRDRVSRSALEIFQEAAAKRPSPPVPEGKESVLRATLGNLASGQNILPPLRKRRPWQP